MKKVLIIFMALATFAINAQNKDGKRKDHRSEVKENFTPEQKAALKAKKMTLALNLNNSQESKVKELFLEMDKSTPPRSENFKEMTSQQKYDAKSAMLDRRIAMQRKIKEILTEEQMKKWERMQSQKHRKGKGEKERSKKR
ncbi:hypothetical protein [Aequorivita sp. Q41]|uniref:hypothetical protein n=1 Tax=Aequorivita sp. Q41 TaxID=3153300 RepID=UPI003242AD67